MEEEDYMISFVVWTIIIGGIAVAFCIVMAIGRYKMDMEEKEAYQKARAEAQRLKDEAINGQKRKMETNYQKLRHTLNIPANCAKIDVETTVFGLQYKAVAPLGKIKHLPNDFYCWNENDTLYIFPVEEHLEEEHITYSTLAKDLVKQLNGDDIRAYVIRRNEIEFFRFSGNERNQTNIRTENTGVNVKGAIKGGLIAGDAGAILGGLNNTHNVYSITEHFDERFVELFYKINNRAEKLKLSVTAYPLLEQWFPEKEYEYVISNSSSVADSDPFEEVKKYKDLLDKGIISEEDFDRKKKELLDL